MSFKSGTILKDMATSALREANEIAEADSLVANSQLSNKAKKLAEIDKGAKQQEIPEGHARFCTAINHMSFILKNGRKLYFNDCMITTKNQEEIDQLREAIAAGNRTVWEVAVKK